MNIRRRFIALRQWRSRRAHPDAHAAVTVYLGRVRKVVRHGERSSVAMLAAGELPHFTDALTAMAQAAGEAPPVDTAEQPTPTSGDGVDEAERRAAICLAEHLDVVTAWLVLHAPDEHGRCSACPGRRLARRAHCRILSAAYEHLVNAPGSAPITAAPVRRPPEAPPAGRMTGALAAGR